MDLYLFIIIIIDIIFYKRYIIRDINFWWKSRKYVKKILKLIKNANIIFIKNQFNIIYNDLNFEFKRNIKNLKNIITINSFFTNLNNYKYK